MNSGLQILEIELTDKCNLNCRHCYLGKKYGILMNKNLACRIIGEAKKLGVHDLILTGGEPLLVPKLFEFARYARKLKIPRIGLQTNGILINEKNIGSIKGNFDFVQLSIDSLFDSSFRKVPNNKIAKAIKLLINEKVPTLLQCTIHKSNLDEMEKIARFGNKLGASVGFNRMCGTGNATNIDDEQLSPKELETMLKKIFELKKHYNVRCSDPILFSFKKASSGGKIHGGCIAGIASCYVSCKGEVYACPFIRKSAGNVNEKSISSIWARSKLFSMLRDRTNLEGKCGSCSRKNICGGCRGSALSHSGRITGPDPLCFR
jgi:radical SAM protein with 4Fe4S-binding SPASM domain